MAQSSASLSSAFTAAFVKWGVQILCCSAIRLRPFGSTREAHSCGVQENADANSAQLEACGIIVRKDMSDLALRVEYDLAMRTRESVCVLLGRLADWNDLYLEKPRFDEKPSGGQIAALDSSPKAQLRSVQPRQS